ncbi:MAG: amidohydrolase family protein [Deltaproteobacteria bacterium]|nr:amidohydrolase family protein [Deltaproteobacteria bacterium]
MRIISAKYLITMTGEPFVDGAVALEGDEIIDAGKEQDLLKRYGFNAPEEDYPHHAIMPGLINCHTHLDMSFYKNFPCDPVRNEGGVVNFIEWLMGCINYKKNISPSEQRMAVEWAVDECISAGTTCIADMSSYEGIFSILEQKNVRAILFPEVLSINNEVAKDLFESAMAIIDKYSRDDSESIRVGAGPYSTYTLSRNILKIMSQFSRSSDIPLMIHAAESFPEMEFFHNSSGEIASSLFPTIGWDELPPEHQRTPIQHLSQIGFLSAAPLLVGCTQVTQTDLDHIAQTGSKVVITPRSHMYLQQGIAPYKEMAQKHILTVLGTDGIPSVDTLSLWDDMRAFIRQHSDATHLTGFGVLSMVTSHAAKALGLENEIGTIEKGKKADLILLDCSAISEEGDFLLNLVNSITNTDIISVMVDGRNTKSVC